MYDFFISHSSRDKDDVVNQFVEKLKKHFDVWYDSSNILSGDTILTKVEEGLKKSYCLVVLLTDNFMKSKWTFYEAGRFSAINYRRIIPLFLNMKPKNQEICRTFFGKLEKLEHPDYEKNIRSLGKILDDCKSANPFLQTKDKLEDIKNNFIDSNHIDSIKIAIELKEYLKLIGIETKYSIHCLKNLSLLVGKSILSLKQVQILIKDYEDLLAELKNNKIGSSNLRTYFEYIFKSKPEDYTNDYFALDQSLLNILNYYKACLPSEIETTFFDDLKITLNNLTIDDFREMYEIDKLVLREDTIASVDTAYSWYKYNNLTHITAKINNTVVGYFAVLPITDELYEKILSGNFKDKDFTTEGLRQYDIEGFYRLYIAAVAIHPNYQNSNVFIRLYHALINFIIDLASNKEYLICEILAEASTPQGKKYCEIMKMKHYVDTPYNTGIYRLFLIPPEFEATNKKIKEFKDFCLSKYNEYKDYFK